MSQDEAALDELQKLGFMTTPVTAPDESRIIRSANVTARNGLE